MPKGTFCATHHVRVGLPQTISVLPCVRCSCISQVSNPNKVSVFPTCRNPFRFEPFSAFLSIRETFAFAYLPPFYAIQLATLFFVLISSSRVYHPALYLTSPHSLFFTSITLIPHSMARKGPWLYPFPVNYRQLVPNSLSSASKSPAPALYPTPS